MSSSEEEEINQHNTDTNTNIVVDLLSLNLDDTGEECMICKEELSCYSCYELPECKHKYHTHCLTFYKILYIDYGTKE